ncbi:hypothetical protein PQX77_007628 [Marasmius sp. AFHP31]|nr:hypothetical protein PQX77_007628 [Marasmius sp. AFHP31]
MGFRSRVRNYVRSLGLSRRNPQGKPLSLLPPPSTTPGVPLSPITEESVRLRAEDDVTPEPVVAQDQMTTPPNHAQRSPPRTAPLEDTQNSRLDRPNNSVTALPVSVESSTATKNTTTSETRPSWQPSSAAPRSANHPPSRSSALFPDQYTPLSVSKCFIVPAGKDDYLVRIIRVVHLGDLSYSRPGEIKFSAPNSYYTPAVGHCVLLQCGWRQFIARVLLKISQDDEPDQSVFRARDPHVEWSLPMLLDEELETLPERDPVVTFTDPNSTGGSVSAAPSPYTPDIGLLRTPANHIGEVRERVYSPESSSDASVDGPTPSPAEDNPPEDQVPPSQQRLKEHQTTGQEEEDVGHNRSEEMQAQGQTTPEEYDPEIEERMASSLDDLGLQRLRSNYTSAQSSGSSAWDTPVPLPRTPPQSQRRQSFSPPRQRISVSAGGSPDTGTPWGAAQHMHEVPPGFIHQSLNGFGIPSHHPPPAPRGEYLPHQPQSHPQYSQPLPPQSHQPQPQSQYYPLPNQPLHGIELYPSPSPNGSWHYTDPVTGYPSATGIRFANDTVVIRDGQQQQSMRGRGAPPPQQAPQPIMRRTRHRQSATVPLPPTSSAESSPQSVGVSSPYGLVAMGVDGAGGGGRASR